MNYSMVAFLTYSEMVILVVLFGLFIAVFSVTFFSLYKSATEKQWKWFAAILASWLLGVGWVFGLVYLLWSSRKISEVLGSTGESKQEVPMTYFESESNEEAKLAHTPARYGLRVKAALIDFIISMAALAVPLVVLIFAIVSIATRDDDTVTSGEGWAIFFSVIGFLFWLLWAGWFFGYRQGKSGTTPGKRAAGICLVSIKTGVVPGGGTGVGRWLLPHLLNSFAGVYWVIDLLWPLWDDANQRLTDKIVSTQVVLEDKSFDTPVLS